MREKTNELVRNYARYSLGIMEEHTHRWSTAEAVRQSLGFYDFARRHGIKDLEIFSGMKALEFAQRGLGAQGENPDCNERLEYAAKLFKLVDRDNFDPLRLDEEVDQLDAFIEKTRTDFSSSRSEKSVA